jgi:hypothetical protein
MSVSIKREKRVGGEILMIGLFATKVHLGAVNKTIDYKLILKCLIFETASVV